MSILLRRLRRLTLTVCSLAVCLLIALNGTPSGVSSQAETTDEEYESTITAQAGTIIAQQTEIAELEVTVDARGEKINAQRTVIAALRTAIATGPTPESGQGQTLEISGNAAVSEPFVLEEGSHIAEVECTGSAYSVFLTLEDAPGTEDVVDEILAFGEGVPYSGTLLIDVRQTGTAVLVLEVIDGDVTCTVKIGEE